jgi:hypothetical protein
MYIKFYFLIKYKIVEPKLLGTSVAADPGTNSTMIISLLTGMFMARPLRAIWLNAALLLETDVNTSVLIYVTFTYTLSRVLSISPSVIFHLSFFRLFFSFSLSISCHSII